MSWRLVLPLVALAVPALIVVLWPLRRLGVRGPGGAEAVDRRPELAEERTTVLRALRELAFDHEAGHISDDDYQVLRDAYEARAARVLAALDALGAAPAARPAPAPAAAAPARGLARNPLALGIGAGVLVLFGVLLGASIGRFTEPDRMATPPGSRIPVPMAPDAGPPGPAGAAPAPGPAEPGAAGPPRTVSPEVLAGMLQAARQALFDGQYPQAIAAYQAVLKREPRNVDALTHLALIVSIGGHADEALKTFDRALAIDPRYAPAHLYRGQVLYDRQDYAAAITAWERFLELTPAGPDRERVQGLLAEARARRGSASR